MQNCKLNCRTLRNKLNPATNSADNNSNDTNSDEKPQLLHSTRNLVAYSGSLRARDAHPCLNRHARSTQKPGRNRYIRV